MSRSVRICNGDRKMKNLLLILFVTFILAGCETPAGSDWGHVGLGRLKSVSFEYDSCNNYTTLLEVNNGVLTVVGKVELHKKPHYYFVWVNLAKRVVYLRHGSVTLEYIWIWEKK